MTSIWAHRGASHDAPENTLEAFTLAADQGADGIELDAMLTADGEVVVCHDETVDRTSDGTGQVGALTLAQLRRLDVGVGRWPSRCTIPTLAEALDLAAERGLVVNVELKYSFATPQPELVARAMEVVAASRLAEDPARIVWSSFHHRALVELVARGTRSAVGVLYSETLVRPWDYARSFGATAVHPPAGALPVEEFADCHEAGVAIHPWTVDDPGLLRSLAEAGADALITNVPALARRALG